MVLSKPKDCILDPVDGFPIILFEKLTHFEVITIYEAGGMEHYFGNTNLSLADFTRALLINAVKLCEK